MKDSTGATPFSFPSGESSPPWTPQAFLRRLAAGGRGRPGFRPGRALFFLIKLSVSGGLLYLVLSRAGAGKVMAIIGDINPWAFALAVLMHITSLFIASVRWRLLLMERLSLRRLFPLYLMCSFFNRLLPGSVGGDAVRTYYLFRETGKGVQALASVFMDRYTGFTALLCVGLLAYPFGFEYFAGSWIQWILPAMALAFVMASLLILGLRPGSGIASLGNLYGYLEVYGKKHGVILKALMLSALVQIVMIFSVYILSLGLGERLPLYALFVFVPIIAAVSAAPVTISGIGVREASAVLLLGVVGVRPETATAISFAWFLSTAAGGLPGLYEYLRSKDHGS